MPDPTAPRPVSVESPGNDGFRYEHPTAPEHHDPPADATCGERIAILGTAHACRWPEHNGHSHACVCGVRWEPRERGCEPAPVTADLNVAANTQADSSVPEPAAPVTAEDLRERYAKAATEWALMYPLANWPWPGRTLAGADAEHLDTIARDIAAAWGRDIADRMLAEVSPVLERFRKAVEDAPAVATWTAACAECGNAIEDGDAITWRLRWSPQGPIHEECR